MLTSYNHRRAAACAAVALVPFTASLRAVEASIGQGDGRAQATLGSERSPQSRRDAWLGFGLECTNCESQQLSAQSIIWRFTEPPTITGIDSSGPASGAGLRAGDVLTHIDAVALAAPQGGRRFGAIVPGQTVVWTFTRNGRVERARMVVGERRVAPRSGDVAREPRPVRFIGELHGVSVEVRGGQASVTIDEGTGELVIRGGDLIVRLAPKR
jgi:hypothetical protein